MIISQRQVHDLVFATVAEAEESGRPSEICYVQETKTGYAYLAWDPVTIDHTKILATKNNGFSRWRAIFGEFADSNSTSTQCTKFKWNWGDGEYYTLEEYTQEHLTGRPLIMGTGAVLEFEVGSDLIMG